MTTIKMWTQLTQLSEQTSGAVDGMKTSCFQPIHPVPGLPLSNALHMYFINPELDGFKTELLISIFMAHYSPLKDTTN